MKVHTFTDGFNTGMVDIEIGQRATVFRLGGFLHNSKWGEKATLKRVTKQHLIWITDSGAEVKTSDWNLFDTRGKAAKAGYSVTLGEVAGLMPEKISYWNDKKMCFEKK